MTLYVARHAETNYNVLDLCNSDPAVDVHLTSLGMQQAAQLSDRLAAVTLDVIYISDLPRTRETASYLRQYDEVPVIVDGRLNDNISGFESKPVHEYLEAFTSSSDVWNVSFNDGETLQQSKQRVDNFMTDLRTKPYAAVCVVTHGFVIACIAELLTGVTIDLAHTFTVPQGEYQIFEI
jgi:probable phosphoglycerate mutase